LKYLGLGTTSVGFDLHQRFVPPTITGILTLVTKVVVKGVVVIGSNLKIIKRLFKSFVD